MSLNEPAASYENKYETIYLDGVLLPDYGEIIEVINENIGKNYTLDGSLYVDYYNNRRSWKIKWNMLTPTEYDTIRALYNKQFAQDTMLMLVVNNMNLFVPCFMTISDKKPKLNGQRIQDFSILLEEQYAIS